ncbi:MAG: endolytic transglycosylase MltG, partial [Planctomycetota bacterium]
MNKLLLVTTAVLFVLLSIFFWAWLDLVSYADKPGHSDPVKKIFIVTRGQNFLSTADSLYQSGLIKNPFKFRILARIKGLDKRIQAGEYLLSSAMSPSVILETLVEGKVNLHKITIPEGSNIYQIAAIAAEAGFSAKEAFIQAATDAEFAHKKAIDADTFEGYLFPDTYYFSKDETLRKIISTMVERFWTKFKPEWIMRAQELGFTIHQVVILASIIEKETGA